MKTISVIVTDEECKILEIEAKRNRRSVGAQIRFDVFGIDNPQDEERFIQIMKENPI